MDVAVLAVEVLGRGIDLAMLTVSFLSFLVFLACFMLIMLKPAAAQSVTDLTLVFHLTADSNNDEVPGTTATALTSLS